MISTYFFLIFSIFNPLEDTNASNVKQHVEYPYEYLQYNVVGGPEQEVLYKPSKDPNTIDIIVSYHPYTKDVQTFSLTKNESNAHIFDLYYRALNDRIPMEVNIIATSSVTTGSFPYWSLVSNGKKYEIGDEYITQTFDILARYVNEKFKPK